MRRIEIFLCSDPAIGGVAEVIGALAAVVAGIGTVWGVWFAALRYRDSVRDKEREQAKSIHAYVSSWVVVEEGEEVAIEHRGPKFDLPPHIEIRSYVETHVDGDVVSTRALKRVAFCKVTVENRSGEIATNVYGQLSVHEATETGRRTTAIGPWEGLPYMLPGSSDTFWVAVPYTGPEDLVQSVIEPLLFFTDVHGRTWTRSPFGPPTLFKEDGYPQPALQAPRQEPESPRELSVDELREAISEQFHVAPESLTLIERQGRGGIFLGDTHRFGALVPYGSDKPVVVAEELGPQAIEQ